MGDYEPVVVDRALLEELRERWRRSGAGIVEQLRPGLTDAKMNDLAGQVGIRLPAEARIWCGWHDGVEDWGRNWAPGLSFMPLRTALDHYRDYRARAVEFAKTFDPPPPHVPELADPETHWPRWLLPLSSEKCVIAIDCDVDPGRPSPVYRRCWDDPVCEVAVFSLGEAIEIWIKAFDAGVYTYDPDVGGWDYEPDRLPLEHGWELL